MNNNIYETKFIVDYMCGRLAKWLRILGYDTEYSNKNLKTKILLKSLQDQRIVITRNTKLSTKKAYKLIFIKYDKVFDQIKQLITELNLTVDKKNFFSRCSFCNVILTEFSKKDLVKSKVPPYVYETQKTFFYCKECSRIYWHGSHYELFLKDINKLL